MSKQGYLLQENYKCTLFKIKEQSEIVNNCFGERLVYILQYDCHQHHNHMSIIIILKLTLFEKPAGPSNIKLNWYGAMQSNSQISWMLLYIATNKYIPGCKMLLEHWFDITLEQIPIMQMSGKFVMLLLLYLCSTFSSCRDTI